MSYTKTEWANGDVIAAEKLNHLENGVAPLVVTVNMETMVLDKTWQEIHDAFPNVYLYYATEGEYSMRLVKEVANAEGEYAILVGDDAFVTDAPNGYPVAHGGNGGN